MKSDNSTVAILMSTYNGKKYLSEQLDSILEQQAVSVTLYVRDDGSTDGTVEILKKYQKRYSNIVVIYGSNLGVGNSFAELIYDEDIQADYYAFSDQDDIWLPDKMISAIERIKKVDELIPVLYAGNQMLIDKEGDQIGVRYNESRDTDYHRIINGNPMSGCTMVWNSNLMDVIRKKGGRPRNDFFTRQIHDVWIAIVASMVGEIIFDMKPNILYRQHAANVVGAYGNTKINIFRSKIKKVFNKRLRNYRSERARGICEYYPELVTDERKDILTYAYYKEKPEYKSLLLKDKEIIRHSDETPLAIHLKVLFGLF